MISRKVYDHKHGGYGSNEGRIIDRIDNDYKILWYIVNGFDKKQITWVSKYRLENERYGKHNLKRYEIV